MAFFHIWIFVERERKLGWLGHFKRKQCLRDLPTKHPKQQAHGRQAGWPAHRQAGRQWQPGRQAGHRQANNRQASRQADGQASKHAGREAFSSSSSISLFLVPC